ncbi:MAG TPA: extracellular solute-binding protein [Candidatus Deferrimicrobiaceae bacterium]|nr:extracellular solute-binding protein [Candidatus Deferrimicrobiaceae bacterium]
MKKTKRRTISRRDFIKATGIGAVAAGVGPTIIISRKSYGASKTLKILQWNHFVPGYDKWFNNVYVKEWGEKNGMQVIVDNIGLAVINSRAAAEVAAQKGHDLFMFLWPCPVYEDQVIDHKEIYQECEKKYGRPIDLAVKSTYNPKTKKYYGFSDSYVPDPINYDKVLWGDIGMAKGPDTWDDMRVGGAKIKKKHGIPVGVGLSAEIDTGMAMRAIMYSFGASVQDSDGNLVLKSDHTLEAIKFVKALFEEAMTPEVLAWDASSNNRAMLAGKVSAVLNAISVTRTAENEKMPIGDRINITKAAKGPVRRIGLEHVMDVYAIWKFAENIEGAKKFLVDYIGNFRTAFLASEFYNFPCFPNTVPDLQKLIAHDPKANPPDKYAVLSDVLDWATNVGYPGYATAAIDEVFSTWVLNTMFAKAAVGAETPEVALAQAEAACKRIWDKWRERKMI